MAFFEPKPWLVVPEDRTICHHFRQRDPASLDFLACEGGSGWPATHTMVPFAVMLFLGNFAFAWLGAGLIEIAEALGLTLMGAAALGRVKSEALETWAGSVIGDWAMNDLFGVLAAYIFLRLYSYPGLLRPWYHLSILRPCGTRTLSKEEQSQGKTNPEDGSEVTFEHDIDLKERWPRACGLYWWKQHLAAFLYIIVGFLPSFVLPEDCDVFRPNACYNVGVMISTVWQLILIICFATFWMRTKRDERYLWRPAGLSRRQVNIFFLLWALFVVMVGMQAWQPFMPLWFIPRMAEWSQVWLFTWLWVLIIFIMRFTCWPRAGSVASALANSR
jgi:hypothetical protein